MTNSEARKRMQDALHASINELDHVAGPEQMAVRALAEDAPSLQLTIDALGADMVAYRQGYFEQKERAEKAEADLEAAAYRAGRQQERLARAEAEREHGYCEHSIEHNERLARQLADVEAERDALAKRAEANGYWAMAAEADQDRLAEQVAAVEALAEEYQHVKPSRPRGESVVHNIRRCLTDPGEALRADRERVWNEGKQATWSALGAPFVWAAPENPYARRESDR